MKTKFFSCLFLGSVFFFAGKNTISAQGQYQCGTTQAHQRLYEKHPELEKAQAEYNAILDEQIKTKKANRTAEQVYIIPIVFHIIHTNGSENISDAQINDQLAILNRDFRKLNADTAAIVPPYQAASADTKIEFRLAQIDPNGNCTNGIDRIYSHKTNQANDGSKLNPWPRSKYLNVWVIKTMESVGTAGYAYYPSATHPWYLEPYDGIIIIHQYIGSIGTGTVGQSRALTHEIGHWLNLPHTWGSTNEPEVGCGDEGVNDTPITKGHLSCGNRYDYTCDSKALTATYSFGGVTTASGTTDPTASPEAVDSSITFSSATANGVSANSATAGMFAFSDWSNGGSAIDGDTTYASLTGAINTAKYYEFTVSPDLFSNALSLSAITFNVQRNMKGVRTFAVRSSADGYASNLAATISPANPNLSARAGNIFFIKNDTAVSLTGSKITLTGASFTNINNASRTFRIYGWNAEDSTGTFGIDNVSLTGTHGVIENVENYMEYSYCSKMYTYDQKARMRAALDNFLSARDNVWIGSNLAATGTDGSGTTCVPKVDFYANKYMVCPGGSVTFTKNVMNITAGVPTTYAWSFDIGTGTPTLSSAATPTITYNTPGMYNATLTATNAGGVGTLTKSMLIYVTDGFAQVSNTYVQNFENSTEYYSHWFSKDPDNNSRTWWYTGAAGYNSSHSVVMNGYYNYAYDVDELYSPSYNLTYIASPALTFRCAAATKATSAADLTEKLIVYSSIDCGATWQTRKTLSGSAFINASYHPEEFVPSSPSQWALQTVTIPGTVATANTRFKFEYTSGNESNNIYIDDINITGVLGIDNSSLADANVSIYPNPANETATVSYNLVKKGNVKIELMDVLGKKIMEANKMNQMEGEYTFQISKQDLNLLNGIYFVKFSIDNTSVTKKLVISE